MNFPQPFMSSIFSVSSHHPFVVPEEFEGKIKGGDQPILKCIEYTDYALRGFSGEGINHAVVQNTLFVITADHVSSNIVFPESPAQLGAVRYRLFSLSRQHFAGAQRVHRPADWHHAFRARAVEIRQAVCRIRTRCVWFNVNFVLPSTTVMIFTICTKANTCSCSMVSEPWAYTILWKDRCSSRDIKKSDKDVSPHGAEN